MRCLALVWVALVATWSDQISSGPLVDCFALLGGSIGLICYIIPYPALRFGLGCIDGYLVGQISSGCLVDCFALLAGSIGLMSSIIPYAVLRFSLGCIHGYLVRSDSFGLFGRFFRALGWFNRFYVFYYTICGASL